MLAGMIALSRGLSLIVTFVPGLIASWAVFAWMYRRAVPLPEPRSFLPLYFGLLALQFVHFGEELAGGFASRFPLLYGGSPYTTEEFVVFNLLAYALFAAAAWLSLAGGRRYLLVPALFFVVYGGLGNAIAHVWWTVYLGGYFPGFVTALVYWLAAPWLFSQLLGGDRKATLAVIVALGLVMLPLLTAFAVPAASAP